MTKRQIAKLQKDNDMDVLQDMINTGMVWHMEGSIGRAAMDALQMGACYLPEVSYRDHYGNKIPSRTELKDGTTGTLGLAKKYWEMYYNTESLVSL